jgi:hypothetical protein
MFSALNQFNMYEKQEFKIFTARLFSKILVSQQAEQYGLSTQMVKVQLGKDQT